MTSLIKKAFGGMIFLALMLGLALLLPAGSICYWQAWVYLVNFFASTTAITVYLAKNDTALLARRMDAGPMYEKQKIQKIIQSIAQVAFLAIFLVSAFDHRFGWSRVSIYGVIAGNVLVTAGFFLVYRVFKENTFTAGNIDVEKEQKVISTGPYAVIRHPMYSGAFILLIGTPVALGSWYGLPAVLLIIAVIIWRLLDEEKFLAKNLAGYHGYCARVRFRLIPGIF
jgi:protein-S-isoprenylcysteine O-methyltransferase Ste14